MGGGGVGGMEGELGRVGEGGEGEREGQGDLGREGGGELGREGEDTGTKSKFPIAGYPKDRYSIDDISFTVLSDGLY